MGLMSFTFAMSLLLVILGRVLRAKKKSLLYKVFLVLGIVIFLTGILEVVSILIFFGGYR